MPIITLVKWAEIPVPTYSHLLRGGGSKPKPINVTLANAAHGSPYHTGSGSHVLTACSPFRATIIAPTSFPYTKYLQAPVASTS